MLEPDGVAVFVTPNRLTLGRPDEIIDPYHHVEFDAGELRALCERFFAAVAVRGLFGSERYMELFDEERRKLDRLLRLRSAASAPRRPGRAAPAALRPDAAALPACGRPAGGRDRAGRLPPARRRPRRRARPRRGLLVAQTAVMRACVWCGAPLEQSAVRQLGRIRCAACGAATIDPWPTDEELSSAYGAWYRPESGRRFGVARRRAAAPHAREPGRAAGRDRPARARPRRRRRRRHADRRAGPARACGHRARARGRPRGPAPRADRGDGRRVGGGRVLALARASARAGGGDPPRGAPARARRCRGRGGARRREPAGAGVRRSLAAPGPAAASGPSHRRAR